MNHTKYLTYYSKFVTKCNVSSSERNVIIQHHSILSFIELSYKKDKKNDNLARIIRSIQYAIQHLKTPLIIVLGHTCCGAVTASHQNKKIKGPLQDLMTFIDDNIILDGTIEDSIKNHTLVTAKKLNEALNLHQSKIEQDTQVIPAIYDISNGHIAWLNLGGENNVTPDLNCT